MRSLSLLLALLFTLSSGCKIRVVVPEGGSVVTLSGSLTCPSGQRCDVTVSDTDFDETFTARAAEGFVFVEWRRRTRGLCGGSEADCQLFTTGFDGQPSLLRFLSSDEIFFLEPVFRKQTPDTFGPGGLEACAGLASIRDARVVTRYRNLAPGQEVVTTVTQYLDGEGLFAGNAATRVVFESQVEGFPAADGVTINFLELDTATLRIRNFGGEVYSAAGSSSRRREQRQTPSSIRIYSPFRETRFRLAPGDSYAQTYNVTDESPPGFVTEATWEMNTTYRGRQTVTVEAGTFEACVVDSQITQTGALGTNTQQVTRQWLAVGSGIKLKQEAGDLSDELLSATIDGVPLQ